MSVFAETHLLCDNSNGKILIDNPTYLFKVKFDILVISINKSSYADKLLGIIEKLPKRVKKKIIFSVCKILINFATKVKIPKLNAETIKAIEDTEKGIGLSKGYTNLEEMWKDLEKED